jgi:hypothetical protein
VNVWTERKKACRGEEPQRSRGQRPAEDFVYQAKKEKKKEKKDI